MRMIRAAGLLGLVVALGGNAQGALTKVQGKVIGPDGAPVVGAEVATLWSFDADKMAAYGGVKTDADGQFVIEAEFYNRPGALVAVDADRKVGGFVTVGSAQGLAPLLQGINQALGQPVPPQPAPDLDPVEIKLGPLIRVHGDFFCPELAKKPVWTNVYMMLGAGKIRVAQCGSREAAFDLKLPVGSYLFNGYGTEEVKGIGKKLELKADQPDLDLGTINLAASPLGKMYDQEAPPLHITDARGISKEMKLTDFRGKWVLLDFWGYWCGPCVAELVDLMQIYDEHPEDRDKFVILAFHDKQAADFAQLDKKLEATVRTIWSGRQLPFPILLDSTGQTVEEYGIESWPTTILINPEGKVVRGGEHALRKALPEVPVARRIPLALDKQTGHGFSRGIKLNKFVESMSRVGEVPIKLDAPALQAAGIAPDTMIPLTMSGQVSLRSWLALGLKPLKLVAVPGPEGLLVTTAQPGATAEPSVVQVKVAERLEQKLGEPATFTIQEKSLAEITSYFEERTGETFILDPADRMAGRLDLKTIASGSADSITLRDGLKALLSPLGIDLVVRDEVIVLTKPATP